MLSSYIQFFGLAVILLSINRNGESNAFLLSQKDSNVFMETEQLTYDSIVSNFHATLLKKTDGILVGWGENMAAKNGKDILEPIEIIPENGYKYTGKPLKFTSGSMGIHSGQYALLTTTGLYVWGKPGNLIASQIKNDENFGSVTIHHQSNGLPPGVRPKEVAMLFGSYCTLAIVTNQGQAWVLSGTGMKNGDGNRGNQPLKWTRVCVKKNQPLKHILAVRGTPFALMALTSNGRVYTWGTNTYLGNQTPAKNRYFATEMELPQKIDPKIIGMTADDLRATYYLLADDGQLFCLGANSKKQLGINNTMEQQSWVQPFRFVRKKNESKQYFNQVNRISPNEHDGSGFPAINVINKNGRLYAWGLNHHGMIGGEKENKSYYPMDFPGNLDSTEWVTAVETGGHTTIIKTKNYEGVGYVGHKIDGSMGDGKRIEKVVKTYQFIALDSSVSK